MRPLIALALLLAACTSEPMDASLPAVPVADAGPPPPMPHGVRCVAPAGFRDIVIGTTTTATARCDVTGDAGELARIVDVAATRPFLATTTATIAASGATFTIEIAYTPTSSLTEDRSVVSVGFETIGQRELTTFEVRGQAVAPIDWAPAPAVPPCRADVDAPLLDRALAGTNLERSTFGFGATDLAESWYDSRALLSDEFVLSWFKPMRAQPHRSGCFEGEVAGALDAHMDSARPVTGAIRHAARWLDRVDDTPPFDPRALPGDHVAALDAICLAYRESCTASTGALPGDLARAIAPVFWAIHEGILARQQRDSDAAPRAPNWWVDHGGNGIIVSTGREGYDRTNPLDRAYLLGENRARLYRAAAQIAHAIESVDWSRFAGRTGVQYDLRTPAGWIRVRDASDDLYVESGDPVLLLIDLGGDDIHLDDVATNRTADNAVSIAIDLEGTDQYAYEAFATDQDRPGLVPADDGGRYAGDANFGTIALSGHFRQGAARNGIAMLFDLGEGDDHYQSLSGSQGYAHQGVGVLYDAGGNDTYLAESVSQGASQYGIGLLIDAGDGWDVRRSFTYSQGFGFVGAFGILADGGGDDIYVCDHGDPNRGGIRLFPSPQLPTSGNSSFCQGAGFGWRGDEEDVFRYMSGGIGVLRDRDGNDTYEASVFAQGTGYWQGTGVLSDGGGSDAYDAYWYVQGAAAHYAAGILADGGPGDDVFNAARGAVSVNLGSGHDFSIGVLINDAGDSEYNLTGLSAGSSNCNGVGLFVDNAGNDTYRAASLNNSGLGNVSGECIDARPNAVSIGVMIDAGGDDRYEYPASDTIITPTNTSTWGHTRYGLPSEHGAGLDDVGETGVHPESP